MPLYNIQTQYPSKKSYAGKASVFTSVKGSITVEAALAVPVFFFAVICMIYIFEIMAVQTSVRAGLQYAGKIAATESYPLSVIDTERIEENVVRAVGAGRLNRSIVIGGSSGISCEESRMSFRTGIGNLTAEYKIRIPIPMFHIGGITRKETIKVKAWTGYEREYLGTESEEIVYVTETGYVYHRDYHCTYLDLSVQMVTADSMDTMRNESGGRYYACQRCGGHGELLYITGNGDRYHSSLSCSGLRRTIYAVPLSEVIGRGVCSRCG